MSVTLQIRLNGGAPQVGGVTGAIGDVVQLTAANKSTWGGAARWEIYDYPPSFTVPAGWTADGDGVFYALGNSDPASFTISGSTNWGKYGFRVTVLDGAVLTTDDATALSIPSTGGIKSIMAGEGAQFGGTRERWVKDLKNDLRALAAGSGGGSGTVTPDPDTIPLRDGTGQLLATAFVGPAAASTQLLAQGAASVEVTSPGRDVTLDAGRDVILDVGSTSDEIAIKAGGATKATITPGASTVTVATATDVSLSLAALGTGVAQLEGAQAKISATAGAAATLRADGGTVVIGDGDEPDALTITPNGSGGTTTIACFQPMSISAAGAMTVQPAQASSGAGRDLTIGGGAGQTPGTHLAGKARIDQGTTVSNVSAATEFVANGTTRLSIIASVINGAFSQILQAGARGLLIDATDAGGSLLLRGQSSALIRVYADSVINLFTVAATRTRRMLSNETTALVDDLGVAVVVAASGAGQLATFDIPANTSVTVYAIITVANRTNKRTSSFHRRFVAQNNAGTGSDNGADEAVVADSIGSGEAGLTVTLDRSGTAVRLNRNTPDADSREFRGILLVHFSSLT